MKTLNLLLIISSLFGYMEWGTSNHAFLWETEWLIFTKIFSDPASVVHPFIILPLIGQLLLLFTLIQKKPSKVLTVLGIVCIGLLLGFMGVIGVLSGSYMISLSVLPFVVMAVVGMVRMRRIRA